MIRTYRNQKITQFFVSVLLLIGIYFFINTSIIQVVILLFIGFIGIAYNSKLLIDIKKDEGFYIFKTYSVITQREEFRISESQLTQIDYEANPLFNSHNLILKYEGTNGIINKKLYLNAAPWSELISDLSQIKKTIVNNV